MILIQYRIAIIEHIMKRMEIEWNLTHILVFFSSIQR
jgi:hypothetical protein